MKKLKIRVLRLCISLSKKKFKNFIKNLRKNNLKVVKLNLYNSFYTLK
jgi:hypothetical protein